MVRFCRHINGIQYDNGKKRESVKILEPQSCQYDDDRRNLIPAPHFVVYTQDDNTTSYQRQHAQPDLSIEFFCSHYDII